MMKGKGHIGLLVFTLGVLLLLLRPFAVYQIASVHQPARGRTLLQRLVKKKDEHHDAATEITCPGLAGNSSLRQVRPALRAITVCFVSFFQLIEPSFLNTAKLNCNSDRYRYRLLSRLLI